MSDCGGVLEVLAATALPPREDLRLLLITSATGFIFDGSRITTATGVREVEIKWDKVPTGANRASFALFRHLMLHFPRATIAAFDNVDKTLADGDVQHELWEGLRIHRGKPNTIADLVKRWPGGFDVALASSVLYKGVRLLDFAEGARRYAMVHQYESLPFGPWMSRTPDSSDQSGSDGWWADVLSRTTLLCASQAVVDFCAKWWPSAAGPTVRAQVSYAADYHYFNDGGLEPLVDDLPLYRPWEPQHKYVTAVSPCEVKGIAVLMALAARLPHVQFMAVATSWTRPQHRVLLAELPNVKVVMARPNFGELLAETRVLLVPSLWAEAFGLVCMEAALRGIPVLSTNHGGLREANVLRECVVPCRMVASLKNANVAIGLTLEEYEDLLSRSTGSGDGHESGEEDAEEELAVRVTILEPLLAAPSDKPPVPQLAHLLKKALSDDKFLKGLSVRASRKAREVVLERRGQLVAELWSGGGGTG